MIRGVDRILVALLQVLIVAAGAPLLVGWMRRLRARFEGRAGPRISQPWRDLRKLWRKERITPQYSSWVFWLTPLVLVVSPLLVAMLIPVVTTRWAGAGVGDLFVVVYLLLLGTVFLALAGLDPGTAFGGMGSSREMTVAALAEPSLLLAIFALSIPAGSSHLSMIVGQRLSQPATLLRPSSLLALAAFAIVLLAETGRLPVDNPATHLELTMIHEAMVLEYAGPDLALVEFGAHARLALFLTLLTNLFFPWGVATSTRPLALLIGSIAVIVKVAVLGMVVAVFEIFVAKLRLFRVPELLAGAFLLSLLSVTISFLSG